MQALFQVHHRAARQRVPVAAVLEEAAAARAIERRTRIERVEMTADAASGGDASIPTADAASSLRPRDAASPRIVIAGGGLAGVRCAHMLWTTAQLPSTIYEAATDHVGGRCWSLRGFFDNGLTTEHGGSFINHDEMRIRDLARSLGLRELEADGGDLPSGEEVFWIDGAIYSYADANADWGAIGYRAFRQASARAPWPQSCVRNTPEGRRLDHLNVIEWLDECGIGANSRFGRLMQQNVMSEFGGEPGDQSALNLLSLLGGTNPRGSLDPVPGYDEKYVIEGGNDQIVTRMLAALPEGTLRPGHRLIHVKRQADSTYACTFEVSGGPTVTTIADYLVLTIPFRMLREVDLSDAEFSPRKMTAINELGFGSIGKIHVQLSSKPWVPLNYAGGAYSDPRSFGVVWDDSVPLGPSGSPALMTIYPTGNVSEQRLTRPSSDAHGTAPAGDVDWFLSEVENVYPGVRSAYMGKAFEDNWAASPHHRGALAYWKVGQVTGFSRSEGAREGNALFAGEHANRLGTGFMNSAIESGEKAARTIQSEI